MKYLKYILSTLLVVAIAACDGLTDPDLPIPLDETLDATGGFVRIIETQSSALDFGDADNAFWGIVAEVGDNEQGQQSDRIEFFVDYVDVTLPLDQRSPEESAPIKTVNVSDLDVAESSGLPRGEMRITLNELIDHVTELNAPGDLSVGDRFDIRWVLHMNDGNSFTNTDAGPSLAGGFYRSPFFARAEVILSLEEDQFVGDYTFTQEETSDAIFWTSGFTAGDDNGWLWNSQSEPETFTVTLSVDPENDLVGRVFDAIAFEAWGVGPREWRIQFSRFLTMTDDQVTGLGCGGDFTYGPAVEEFGTFDPEDDSGFQFFVTVDSMDDCGQLEEDIPFTAARP